MEELTGGGAIVEALIAHGVDTIFGLPGVQNDHLYNALYDRQDRMRVIHPRHEQGAAYMALGYTLASGNPGVYSVVPGPGVLNSTAALATAYALNAKVLCLTGQIPSAKIGRRQGALHEIPDQMGVMERLTKWYGRIERPAEAPLMVGEALRQMQSGRPRPVGLEAAMDVLARSETVDLSPLPLEVQHAALNQSAVEKAASALLGAKQGAIYVANGALDAAEEVRSLAEMLEIPVFSYRTGNGIMDRRHHLSHSHLAAHDIWHDIDVLLLVGATGRLPLQRWGHDKEMTIIRLDADATVSGDYGIPSLDVVGQAKHSLQAILPLVERNVGDRQSRAEEMAAWKAATAAKLAYLEPQMSQLKAIREALPEDGIFVDELTQNGYASRLAFPAYHPRTFLSSGYQGTLGWGIATAMGAQVAAPDRKVVSIVGDGGFLFNVQELATAVQHDIGVTIVLFNDNAFGNVQRMQREIHGGRVIATELRNPDFMKLAESFGVQGLQAESSDELKKAIELAMSTDGPALIEVPQGNVPSIDKFRSLPRKRG